MPTIINCSDCGSERKAQNKNTKYCHFHRLLRDMSYIATGRPAPPKRTCILCDEQFIPVTGSPSICGACTADTQRNAMVTCGICHEHRQAYLEGIFVCGHCATSPKQRDAFFRLVKSKCDWLTAHPQTLAEQQERWEERSTPIPAPALPGTRA